MRSYNIKRKKGVYVVVCFTVLLAYSLIFGISILWAFMTSVKDRLDYASNMLWLPKYGWQFSNYARAFQNFFYQVTTARGIITYYYWDMLINSLLYAVGCTFFATMVPCLVAYATAKYKFRFNKYINGAVIFAMAVPIVGALPSEIKVAQALGFYDNLLGMWLMKANFLGMYYLIFQATFKSMPWEYAESVFIDGGGHYTVLFKIMLPLCKTTVWVVAVLLFITFWNDYQTPLMFLPSMPTAAMGLYKFRFVNLSQEKFGGVPMEMTGSMILMLPMIVLFILLKDKMMGNLAMGGLKG